MKKVFFSMVVIALSITTLKAQYRQQQEQPLRFGVSAGMNVSTFSSPLVSSRVGFHLGGKMELDFSHNLFLESGLLLSLKGAKIDMGDLGNSSANPFYLEIPIRAGYKYEVTNGVKLFGTFGPYLAFGLFGKANSTTLDYELDKKTYQLKEVTNETSENFFGEESAKRFDMGIGLHAGVEFSKKYQLSLGYDWGLMNLYKSGGDDIDLGSTMKNRNFTITLSYMF